MQLQIPACEASEVTKLVGLVEGRDTRIATLTEFQHFSRELLMIAFFELALKINGLADSERPTVLNTARAIFHRLKNQLGVDRQVLIDACEASQGDNRN